MTGQDLQFWLEDLWFDLMNFGQADVLSLIFRLFVLAIVVVVLWGIAESLMKRLSKILSRIKYVVLIPARLPKKYYRARKQKEQDQKNQEAWEQEQKERERQARIQQEKDDQKRQEEIEAIKKALRMD